MIKKELIREVKKRLHYIKGQVEGIERMIDKGREPNDIVIQFKAVEGAVKKAIYEVLDETLRKDLALRIVEVVDACPGNCEYAGKIQSIKRDFPNLKFEEITQVISEIQLINEKIKTLTIKTSTTISET